MCGRFSLRGTGKELLERFDLAQEPGLDPRYNIAPSQDVGVVRRMVNDGTPHNQLDLLKWGLVPFWADDPKIGNKMINARSETAAEKPAFRAAFKRRRCLIPADGFYEWKKTNGGKQPYFIRKKDNSVFGFAGLWEKWEDEDTGESLETVTILTTSPNKLLKPIHGRMPVILHPSRYDSWLDPNNEDQDQLNLFLTPFQSDELEAYPVSKHVNNPQNEDKSCVQPLKEE